MAKDITSLRSALDFLKEEGYLLVTDKEVNPVLEMAGIQKALDGGPAILFENVKDFPDGKRLATNLFSNDAVVMKMFDVDNRRDMRLKVMDAIRRPLAPREVTVAPCQEVVYTGDDVDPNNQIPLIQHTPTDPGRTLGGGNTLVTGKYFWGGTHIAYNRMNFRERNVSSFQISPGSHGDMIATEWYKKEPIPMTINMGMPPAATMVAGSGFNYMVLPKGCDELGIAGALQGSPIEIVKAKTVDAYAVANAEYVIEGYLDTTGKVWESPLAEKENKQGVFPFHPEWSGYMGKAYRTYKFVATAVTHRKDRAIYNPHVVHGFDAHNIDVTVREACFWEIAERIAPGLVMDVSIPLGMSDWGGVVYQIRKRRKRDEGFQKNILAAAIATSIGLRLAIAVDPDINIENGEDILWSLATRVDGNKDIQIVAAGGMGQTFQPAERSAAAPGAQWVRSESKYAGGIAIDATTPIEYDWAFERAKYPVELVGDLSKWFSQDELNKARALQNEYATWLSKVGI